MIQTTFFKLTNSVVPQPSKHTKLEYVESVPFDAIILLIDDLRKDEDYARGEDLDKLDSQLSEKEAHLRRHLERCNEPSLRQELEGKLSHIIYQRGKISEQFDEPYEPWME